MYITNAKLYKLFLKRNNLKIKNKIKQLLSNFSTEVKRWKYKNNYNYKNMLWMHNIKYVICDTDNKMCVGKGKSRVTEVRLLQA